MIEWKFYKNETCYRTCSGISSKKIESRVANRFHNMSKNALSFFEISTDCNRASLVILFSLLFSIMTFGTYGQSAEEFFELGKEQAAKSNYKSAVDLYGKAINIHSTSEYYASRAAAHMWLNANNNAISDFSKAIEIGDKKLEYFELRGKLLFKESKFLEANEDFKQVLSMDNTRNEITYLYALSHYRLSNLGTALQYFQSIFDSFRENYVYLNYYGLVLLDLDRFEESVKFFDMAIKLSPEKHSAFNNKAAALNFLGIYDKAILIASEAIKRDSTSNTSLNHRAYAYLKTKKLDEAISDVQSSILVNGEYSKVYYTKGLIEEELGQLNQALVSLKKSMDL